MAKIINSTAGKSSTAAFKSLVRKVFTVDPAATRMLEDNFVKVHLSSRIWMV
ncbi:MAG: hypothetical protein KGO53_14850 [Alphaproteobacteria bacterium]|nr:hypothetical protein [Alphaproteobacteria bacterium]